MATNKTSDLPEVVIRPIRGPEAINLREVWHYRDLLLSMVVKDLRVKYDALHLGFLWPIARPLLVAVVVALFKQATNAETGEAMPYLLFVYAGVVFWFYFAESLAEVAAGLQRDASLLMKVYYPRIISPAVALFSGIFELAVASVPLVVMMLYYRVAPGLAAALFPLVLVQLMLFAFGSGLILSYLTMYIKDFERVVGLVLYVGIFVSPVFHGVDILPQGLRWISAINPMVGTLTAMRACLFGIDTFPVAAWLASCVATALTLWVGLALFRRVQHKVLELM